MSLRHIWAITLKELRHIRRDRATLAMVLFAPTVLLILFAYGVTVDIKHVPVAIMDMDRSQASRGFIQQITVGEDLELVHMITQWDEIEDMLLRGHAKAVIVIPAGFEADLLSMQDISLQVIIDGTEPQSGGFALEHVSRRIEDFTTQQFAQQLSAMGISESGLQPIDWRIRTWYNPNLQANVDLIPGLLSMILSLPGMTAALTLAREREHGTLEQLMATPVTRTELLLGKIGPYIIGGMLNLILTTAVAMLLFDVPLQGSFGLFLLVSVIFYFAVLSMGMLVGVFVHSQAGAMAVSIMLLFLPGMFLTGVFFPVSALPLIVRMEAMVLPGSHYSVVTRGIFTIGVGLDVLWPNVLAMLVLGLVFTTTATLFFRKRLA